MEEHAAWLAEAQADLRSGQREDAYDTLVTYLALHPENPDAWYLAALAAPNLSVAFEALEETLRLAPDHAGGRSLRAALNAQAEAEDLADDTLDL